MSKIMKELLAVPETATELEVIAVLEALAEREYPGIYDGNRVRIDNARNSPDKP